MAVVLFQPDIQIIEFNTLKNVTAITEGGFGVISTAEHDLFGDVVYKALKTTKIADDMRLEMVLLVVLHISFFCVCRRRSTMCALCARFNNNNTLLPGVYK